MKDKEQARLYAKEVRAWRKAHKVCVRCGKEKAYKNFVLCLQCRGEENYKRQVKYQEKKATMTEQDIIAIRQKKREINARKKEEGICLQCSKPRYKNHAYCYEHYLGQKRVHKKVNEQKKKDHNACGLCRICNKPKLPKSAFCEEHYNEYSTRMREYNYMKAKEREEMKNNESNQG